MGGLGLLLAIVVIINLVSFVLFTGFYTDWLWFDSVAATSVYSTQLLTRAILFGAFGATGTPVAVKLDRRGRVASPLAAGTEQVRRGVRDSV